MKHIVFCGNTAWSMYNFRGSLIKHLVTLGYKVSVVAPKDEYVENIKKLGCAYFDINVDAKGVNPVKDIKLIFFYRQLFKQLRPDFIFFYTIKPNIYGSLSILGLSIPSICITTGLGYTFIANNAVAKIARFLYRVSFTNAHEVWFLNNSDFETFLNYKIIKKDKGRILNGEGINLIRFYPTSDQNESCSFLLIARLLWDKGIGEYVSAARVLKKKYPAVHFNLLGFLGVDNPSAISKEQVEKWIQEGAVSYLGATKDVIPYITGSSCIVLPSYREGLPISLLESSAMCKPIIATDVPGCKDVIDDGVTGFICKVKSIESLVDAMEKIIKMTPSERQLMGEFGRKKIECKFDEKLIINEYVKTIMNYFQIIE